MELKWQQAFHSVKPALRPETGKTAGEQWMTGGAECFHAHTTKYRVHFRKSFMAPLKLFYSIDSHPYNMKLTQDIYIFASVNKTLLESNIHSDCYFLVLGQIKLSKSVVLAN